MMVMMMVMMMIWLVYRILHIVRVMIILCYLSWSVDFSTDNDDDDVSTVYATWLLYHHYLSTHLSSTLLFDDFFALLIWVNCCISWLLDNSVVALLCDCMLWVWWEWWTFLMNTTEDLIIGHNTIQSDCSMSAICHSYSHLLTHSLQSPKYKNTYMSMPLLSPGHRKWW